jgi:hypothetical protein
VETGTASCFAPLAADRLRRLPFARPTSPGKTRVRGFYGCSSGRFSSRHRKPHRIATGCGPCGYKTASGRSKWPNRDPLGEPGAEVVVSHGRSGIQLAELTSVASLYAFVANDPADKIDRDGRQPYSWIIRCLNASQGTIAGPRPIKCTLQSSTTYYSPSGIPVQTVCNYSCSGGGTTDTLAPIQSAPSTVVVSGNGPCPNNPPYNWPTLPPNTWDPKK